MNMVAHPGAEGFLHRFEGLKQRLPGARLPWVAALRDQAAEKFRAQGFPTRRIEAWHYTDLRPLTQASFDEPLTVVDDALTLPPARTAERVVFVDGRLRMDLSSWPGMASVANHLAKLQDRILLPEEPLAALNTMMFEDGLSLHVPAGTDAGTLEVLSVAIESERPAAFHPRHLVRLEKGAKLTLLETSIGPAGTAYLHNPVWQIEVAEDATLTHARLQQEGAQAFHLSTIYAEVAKGGTYDNFTLNAGGRLVRNEIHSTLTGPKAACHMNGAQLVADGQHVDTTTFLDHAAPGCASRQTYKTVLNGKSRGVFQGKILVRQAAQQTDGYQMNQALLLSPEAEIDSKPQLEIYADDVKCSHGATVGEIDADQLFYLRTRGVPAAEARSILVRAFLHEAVEGLSDDHVRGALEDAIETWWQRQAA
jgi:Fe-S cluster assembly protein SufD